MRYSTSYFIGPIKPDPHTFDENLKPLIFHKIIFLNNVLHAQLKKLLVVKSTT